MKNLSKSTIAILVSSVVVLLSLFLHRPLLFLAGILTILISLRKKHPAKLSKSMITLLIGLSTILASFTPYMYSLRYGFISHPDVPYFFGGILIVLISLACFAQKNTEKIMSKCGRHYYPSFILIAIIGYILFTAANFVVVGFVVEWDLTTVAIIALTIFSLIASTLYTYLYFLPYLIANKHKHTQTRAIYILNIFAGWTILAWLISLIWSVTVPKATPVIQQNTPTNSADELRKFKELLDQNIITEEEFEAKKKQLLGL